MGKLGAFPVNGAGNETRTHDLYLGKVSLYQLSYSRKTEVRIIWILPTVSRKRPEHAMQAALNIHVLATVMSISV